MRTLTFYVLSEVVKVFLVSLAGLTMLMIIGGVFREAMNQGIPMTQVVRLLPYILPNALRFAVPATLLLATTTVYCRMSGANEVVAAKSMGISPTALLLPTWILAFLISLAMVWINDLEASWGRNGVRRVVVEAIEEIVYSALDSQQSYSAGGFKISVMEVEGRRLIRPTVTLGNMTIMAEEAELRADIEQGVLKLRLWNYTVDSKEGEKTVKIRDPGVWEQEIPLLAATRAQTSSKTPSWLPLRQIPEEERAQWLLIERTEQEMAAWAGCQMLSGDFAGLTSNEWAGRFHELDRKREHWHRLLTEPHRRWSNGFSCLFFVWAGAPLAIRLRNSDFLTSFFLCFLPILIVYYPLLILGANGAKDGAVPPECVWAGNVLLLLWGGWLLRRVIRY